MFSVCIVCCGNMIESLLIRFLSVFGDVDVVEHMLCGKFSIVFSRDV